jgi:hypothetical protein
MARFFWHGRAKTDPLETALGVTVETPDTITLLQDLAVEGRWAMLLTVTTIRAKPRWESLKDTEVAQQTEQTTQRAEVFAPIPPLVTLKEKNGCKKKKRQKGKGVEGFPKREQVTLEKTIASRKVVPVVSQKTVKAHPTLTESVSYQGIEEKGEGAYQQSDGVQKPHEVHAEKGRKEKRP